MIHIFTTLWAECVLSAFPRFSFAVLLRAPGVLGQSHGHIRPSSSFTDSPFIYILLRRLLWEEQSTSDEGQLGLGRGFPAVEEHGKARKLHAAGGWPWASRKTVSVAVIHSKAL